MSSSLQKPIDDRPQEREATSKSFEGGQGRDVGMKEELTLPRERSQGMSGPSMEQHVDGHPSRDPSASSSRDPTASSGRDLTASSGKDTTATRDPTAPVGDSNLQNRTMDKSRESEPTDMDKQNRILTEDMKHKAPLSPSSEYFVGRKRSELIPSIDRMSVDIGNFTYRLPAFKDHLLQTSDPEVRTVFDAWLKTVYEHGNRKAFGFRRRMDSGKLESSYTWLTFKEAEERIQVIASGILNLGMRSGQVGIFSENRPEWQLVNLTIARMKNFHLVPINYRYGQSEINKIIQHSEASIIFCSGKQLENLLRCSTSSPHLKTIVCFDHITIEQQRLIQSSQYEPLRILSYYDLLRMGRQNPLQDFDFPNSDDILLVCYTSGTTGNPKGVLLTHGNVIATTASLRLLWTMPSGEQRIFSYLPLSHILQYIAEQVVIEYGNGIGYWSDDPKNIYSDISCLSPTLMTTVPITANKIERKIKKSIKKTNPLVRLLFKPAYKTAGGPRSFMGKIWEKFVFRKIKEKAGFEHLNIVLSGGAPLLESTQKFLQTTFHVPVLQAYGLTETCAGGTMQLPEDTKTMRVGAPLACNELRIRSVEEMGYRVTDEYPRGELLIRGYNVSPGYFKDDALTNEAFLPDGFFCTGDIVERNKDGSFSLIDRKKNIVKLAQGEYVPIEYLQRLYMESKYVKNMWIYGSPNHSQLIAVVHPHKKVKEKKVLKSFNEIAKRNDMKGYERIKGVHFVKKDFKELDPELESSSGQIRNDRMESFFRSALDKKFSKIQSKE